MSNDPEKELSQPESPVLPTMNPSLEKSEPSVKKLHPAVYVISWISLSSTVIIFNKWILDDAKFDFPILLTTWHLAFATFMTQVLSRTTTLLDGRKTVKMTGRVYLRTIVPIGAFYSLSLICGNLTYLYLNVAFIQMLKATTPVAVLLAGWAMGAEKVDAKMLLNVSFIVIGVIIASIGEIQFVLVGFIFQLGGIVFEAIRLVMVQSLLSSAEYKMDPLVSLYYFAPVCAMMNFCFAIVFDLPRMTMAHIYHVGLFTLLLNAVIAFALNVSVVFLIGRTSSLVLTLCGVLKDILLVCASIAIWGTPISGLQFFGYSIALCGLVYYKLGGETLKTQFGEMNRLWAEYGARHPALRKVFVFAVGLLLVTVFLYAIAPSLSYKSIPTVIGADATAKIS